MKTWKLFGMLLLAGTVIGMNSQARADDQGSADANRHLASLWILPKEEGKLTLVLTGQSEPVTVAVSEATVFGGICQDCQMHMEFKANESGKKCSVCGCDVTNAACIVGKPVKTPNWQGMLKGLPRGTGFQVEFNDPQKPDSGVKKLIVNLRTVLLPVTGLDNQTPDQLLALVKPLGGTEAELIDGGKRLSIHLKSDWTAAREDKLEKALTGLNAKILQPEETTTSK